MSFRQDKLVLLLETGTSSQVRRTAAKQLSDLTVKTFRASRPEGKEEVQVDVKPDVTADGVSHGARITHQGQISEDDSWAEVLETVANIVPLLRSKISDTRSAAAHTLGLLAASLPTWKQDAVPHASTSRAIDLPDLLRDELPLLASAGREYIAKPTGGDRAKRRKAMMGSLGLGDAVGWGDDVDKVIGDEDDEDVNMDSKKAAINGTVSEPSQSETPKDIFEGLSARQAAMIKRRKGNMAEEANKMRRLNQVANGNIPATPSHTSTPNLSPAKQESNLPSTAQAVVIDPGAKARAAAAGGAVEPSLDPEGNAIAGPSKLRITPLPGQTPWTAVLEEVLPDLADPVWQVRHGSALAVLDVVRASVIIEESFLVEIARQLLALLVLDRFGDFIGDTVIAPVRETAAQALGVTMKYLSLSGVQEVHEALVEMVIQRWAKRGKQAEGKDKWEKLSWELRHAGLLGLKYELAVRVDLLSLEIKADDGIDVDLKPDVNRIKRTILTDVLEATTLALRDSDDDVRTVAATALLPVTSQLASELSHDDLSGLLDVLWDCLGEGGDELGSSTGAVMDLLGDMISKPQVVSIIGEGTRGEGSYSRFALIARVLAFIRHPIAAVRLAVVNILLNCGSQASSLGRDWIDEDVYRLLFQNIVLEERQDVRDVSFTALQQIFVVDLGKSIPLVVDDWYTMVMTPIGSPFDADLFLRVGRSGGYDVDKAMMAGDLGLMPSETMLKTRIQASKVLARARSYMIDNHDVELLCRYLQSGSAHQTIMAAIVTQEWAMIMDVLATSKPKSLGAEDMRAQTLTGVLLRGIENPPPATYHEMSAILSDIASECQALLSAFAVEAKVPKDKIPAIPKRVDPLSLSSDVFSLNTAQTALSTHFDALTAQMSKNAAKTVLPSLKDRQRKIMASIGYYAVTKERYDVQVGAAVAGALIALRVMPQKFGPVIKAVMDSVKKEESDVLQARSASAVAAFVAYCNSPLFTAKVKPSDKIVKNLFTFLCSDTAVTPVFIVTPTSNEGILTLKEDKASIPPKKGAAKDAPEESEEQLAMRITRRGALETFKALTARFEGRLFEEVPKFWEGISAPLLAALAMGAVERVDDHLGGSASAGQDLVDALTSLRFVCSHLNNLLHPQLGSLFPPIVLALQSSFTVIRNTAAKCLAALCHVMTEEGMRRVVDDVVPLVGDAKRVSARQGAVEAIHHIIRSLDLKALPYVLFLIVPILGRMSDPDEPVRMLSTSTFASLVKMVPLEAGIPDPPGFSPQLLAKRDEERKFLMQLLDGSKAEQYQIPIPIKADLRQYQKDGVSWLAFLAKYQLHGILCDDMGLGKSLQSICIIGSKHFERAEKHKATSSPDSAHLPSLIVCPPTLTGHWYYEIQKFTDYLRPIQYTGSTLERAALRSRLTKLDVVITSYETVRADIGELGKIDWLYCVLDEGHIVKNPKTKLAVAIKQLRAQHRLLLSGTPIQNNVLELWSLFDFLMPGFLGSERVFNERFSKPILADRDGKATPKEREAAATALEALHKQVLPFLLRRLKEDVLNDLPPKIIQDYFCELSPVQKHLYDEFSRSRAAEEAGEAVTEDAPGQGHVFQSLQYLRKLCNHPALVLGVEERRFEEIRAKVGGGALRDIEHAPKLEALRQLLLDCGIGAPPDKNQSSPDLPQHRVLIFCQLRPMLDLIERDLFAPHLPSLKYMRMDGSTDPRKRHAIVQTFNGDPNIDVLLLTTSVGGLGLNLTGADTVIFVDHDWNPMKDLQAMDRAHRLGQKKVVNVYRLITRGTLEEKIMGLQRFKLNIASSVVTQQNAGLGSMNTGEVLDLFKVSAEGDTQKQGSKQASGPVSASKILEGLDDLPPEDEYAELSLSNFMSKV